MEVSIENVKAKIQDKESIQVGYQGDEIATVQKTDIKEEGEILKKEEKPNTPVLDEKE